MMAGQDKLTDENMAEIEKMINAMDKDSNGLIDFREFLKSDHKPSFS